LPVADTLYCIPPLPRLLTRGLFPYVKIFGLSTDFKLLIK